MARQPRRQLRDPMKTPWGDPIPGAINPDLPTDPDVLDELLTDLCTRLARRRERREVMKRRRNRGELEVSEPLDVLLAVARDNEGDDSDLLTAIQLVRDQLDAVKVSLPRPSGDNA
jgi:hypothetical protein